MSTFFALMLSITPHQPMPQADPMLLAIRCIESDCGRDKRDGDRHRPICERSVGDWQVTPRAVRHLVAMGRLDASEIPGYSETNCSGIRAWLKTWDGGLRAASLYWAFMLEVSKGDVERALASWNCGYGNWNNAECHRFAGAVLLVLSGE